MAGLLDRFNEFMTPERAIQFQGVGQALSQLGAGQPVDISNSMQALNQRREAAAQKQSISELSQRFTPDQQAVLASMPPELAMQVISQDAFRAPAAPTAGINVGGNLVNPITGEVIYQAPVEVDPGFAMLTPDEVAAAGLPPGSYQRSGEGRIHEIGGGGQTINVGPQGQQFGEPGAGLVWQRDAQGNVAMDERGAPIAIPFQGGSAWVDQAQVAAEAEAAAAAAATVTAKENEQSAMMLNTIDGLMNDPGLSAITGLSGRAFGDQPTTMGDTLLAMNPDAARAMSKHRQVQGQVFLDAFEALKGGGQITEVEGRQATAARARLLRAQSQEDYTAALQELRDIVAGTLTRPQGWIDTPDGQAYLSSEASGAVAAPVATPAPPPQPVAPVTQPATPTAGVPDLMNMTDEELDAYIASGGQ